jgi:hypothetical protein
MELHDFKHSIDYYGSFSAVQKKFKMNIADDYSDMLGMLITWFKEGILRLDGERFDPSHFLVALQLLLVGCDVGLSILLGSLALSILVRFLKGPRNEQFLSMLIDGFKEVLGSHFLFLQVLCNVVLGYIN